MYLLAFTTSLSSTPHLWDKMPRPLLFCPEHTGPLSWEMLDMILVLEGVKVPEEKRLIRLARERKIRVLVHGGK